MAIDMAFRSLLPVVVFILIGICAGAVLLSDQAEGRTWYVDDDGGADSQRIQAVMSVSEDGDTIRVYEGVYYEHVVVNKRVSLVGNGSTNTTIRLFDEETNGVEITVNGVNISGFAIENGRFGIRSTDWACDHVLDSNCFYNNGIYLRLSRNNTISNNTGNVSSDGGYNNSIINNVGNISLGGDNNTISNNIGNVSLDWADNNTISNNTGNIRLDGSYNSITNNTGNWILLLSTSNNVLIGNKLQENGIYISGSYSVTHWNTHSIDTSNTVNKKPVYYYKNVTGITIPAGAGQVILANCDDITVENQNCSNTSIGIQISHSRNITISNNTCSFNAREGISIFYSENITLTNNTCLSNKQNGIYLRYLDNSSLFNNTCLFNQKSGVFSMCSHTTFAGNALSDNARYGILLQSSFSNVLTYNEVSGNNRGIGLFFHSSVVDYEFRKNVVHHNNVSGNREYGIWGDEDLKRNIDVTKNWWGDGSGPYHPRKNPQGKGDNASDFLDFSPWLDEDGELVERESDSSNVAFCLCFSILCLTVISVVVAKLFPDKFFEPRASSGPPETGRSAPEPRQIGTCPHCGGEFDVTTAKRPVRFTCHFCRKAIEFK